MNLYQSSDLIKSNSKNHNDPWGEKKSSNEDTNHDKGYSQVYSRFKKLFFLRLGNRNKHAPFLKYNLFFIVMMIIISWVISGFYTIKESDRGIVTRFGKVSHIVFPGLNWKFNFIDKVYSINVEAVREIIAIGRMLTSDENLVDVEMNVQYRITNPINYLFSVNNPDESLRQATDSALRGVIGKSTMNTILTEGRTIIRRDTKKELEKIIDPYNMGITLLDVNLQSARPPEEVKSAFDDAIAARENEEQYIREAEAYSNEVQPQASGRAQRIIEEAYAYKKRTILEAQGEVTQFTKILPEYRIAPEITKERLYIESIEYILSHTHHVVISSSSNNIFIIPMKNLGDRDIRTNYLNSKKIKLRNRLYDNNQPSLLMSNNKYNNMSSLNTEKNDIMSQRKANAIRTPRITHHA